MKSFRGEGPYLFTRFWSARVVLYFCLLVFSSSLFAVEITSPLTISATDTTYDNADLTVNGTTLTIDGNHTFTNLSLINSAVLTTSVASTDKLNITASTVTIDATSRIDVTNKGLGNGGQVNSTNGGSYGGRGGLSNTAGLFNAPYGDALAPSDFGTGGSDSSTHGGGAVKLTATTLQVDGQILARGTPGYGGGSGGSIWLDVGSLSGTGTIDASGGNANATYSYNGGGGGGRIAVLYDSSSFDLSNNVIAAGGQAGGGGYDAGGAGTVYLYDRTTAQGQMKIDNLNRSTAGNVGYAEISGNVNVPVIISNTSAQLSGTFSFPLSLNNATVTTTGIFTVGVINATNSTLISTGELHALNDQDLTIDGSITVAHNGPITLQNLYLHNGVVLTHQAVAAADAAKLVITANRVEIDASSRIDVSGKGLLNGGTVTGASGGSYGGSGGVYSTTAVTNPVYGDLRGPLDFGTGGAGTNSRGGGAVKITVNELVVDGEITAMGSTPTSGVGSGSGGSIWLDVGILSGSGSISANGADALSAYTNGGGGGGRIAIYYNSSSLNLTTSVFSAGGQGGYGNTYAGGAGTIYLFDKSAGQGSVLLDNTGRSATNQGHGVLSGVFAEPVAIRNAYAQLDGAYSAPVSVDTANITTVGVFSIKTLQGKSATLTSTGELHALNDQDLTIDGSITVAHNGPITLQNLYLHNGVVLTHQAVAAADAAKLVITANRVEIDASSRIDVSGKGLLNGGAVTGASGGSYGGGGGVYNGVTNAIYGNEQAPADFGTGGAGTDSRGGGAVKVVANELVVDGHITAMGSTPTSGLGSGSGGSIWLDVGILSGSGSISANGADARSPTLYTNGGGGGGRIAIYYNVNQLTDITTQAIANGGAGGYGGLYPGSIGTVYIKSKDVPLQVMSASPDGATNQAISHIQLTFNTTVDPATFTVDDVSLTGPGGAVIPTSITRVNEVVYTIDFATPISTNGDYQLAVGPNIQTSTGNGMDQNQNGIVNEPGVDAFATTITLDNVAPTGLTLNPVTTPTNTTPITLSGTKEANTAIYINGNQVVSLDALTTWSVSYNLINGNNDLSITAHDEAGNVSAPIVQSIFLDRTAPYLSSMSPANGAYTNTQPATIQLNIGEQSGLDATKTIPTLEVHRGSSTGTLVTGTWSSPQANQLQFTPNIAFTEDTYFIVGTLTDKAGNTQTLNNPYFVYDATPPALPVINPVTSPTSVSVQTITGTKEANSRVLFNNTVVLSYTTGTTFSIPYTLTPGNNTISVTLQDRAGNTSGAVPITINFDDTAPPQVTVLSVNATGSGTTADLNWTAYDETLAPDIVQYRIYRSTVPYIDVVGMTPIATTNVGVKVYTDTGLTRTQAYYYAVVAVDQRGNLNTNVTAVPAVATDVQAPEEVTNVKVTVAATSLTLNWTGSTNKAGDLANYRIYVNGDAGTLLPPTQTSYTISGLTPSSSYPIRITTLDNTGNESTGVNVQGVTQLANPTGLTSTPYSGKVTLSWSPVSPTSLVKSYALYASTANFTSVAGMTPKVVVTPDQTTHSIAGLTNGTLYYFAVTAINLSGGENPAVTTISDTPVADKDGPTVSNIQFNGAGLTSGATINKAGTISVSASDPSGISRVDFSLDGVSFNLDTNGSDGYSASFDPLQTTDGAHTITIVAYDTLDNSTTVTINITVATTPPDAPTFTAPANNTVTNQDNITVQGKAEKNSQVQLYNNGTAVGGLITATSSGAFSGSVTNLVEGSNSITATAQNRGGVGQQSPPVIVKRDSTVPDAPAGLAASAQPAGQIRLTWNPSTSTNSTNQIVGYDVYRSTSAFDTIAQGSLVNSQHITTNSFTDLPSSDGTYYYRVVAVNAATTSSAPSNLVNAVSDSVAPHATSITYTPSGQYDSVTGRMAPGAVAVDVIVSEPLLTTPFLSIATNKGVPLNVTLSRYSDTEYKGTFTILDTTPTGQAFAVFSARDVVGNRGTQVDAGATINIDTQGPIISNIVINPKEPVRNDSSAPVTIDFQMDMSDVPVGTPTLNYLLSGAGRSPVPVNNFVQTDTNHWHGQLILPSDAGLAEVENLSFQFKAVDDLGNVSTTIQGDNSFQIYQGDLPPLAVPTGLTGKALPKGQVSLSWNAVDGAVEYQVYRQAPGETALTDFARTSNTTFSDTTTIDGAYIYSVASVRQDNGQEGVSAQATPVTVNADATAPTPPQTLALELQGAGIHATWVAPTDPGKLTYNLYRSATEILDLTGMTPVMTGITDVSAIDAKPSQTEHYYAVTAVDAAGNESAPSNSPYLNFDLLPVSSFTVEQVGTNMPTLTWTDSGTTITGYNLYLGANREVQLNNSGLLTATTYTDSGFNNDTRIYTVTAVDNNNTESIGRTVTLPQISATLSPGSSIKRGIMNQVEFTVTNHSTVPVSNIQLHVKVQTYDHISQGFNLAAGETQTIPVIIGGYADLPDVSSMTTTAEITPNVGETVRITRTQDIDVSNSALVLNITTDNMARGTNGKVQFSLENTSDVETEIITATSNGTQASNEVRFKLVDADNNILSTQSIKIDSGADIVRLANGTSVARIQPGATFTSPWLDLPIPVNAPDKVYLQFGIDQYHYHLSQQDQVAIAGKTTQRDVLLTDTPYYGQLTGVSPAISYGQNDIIITGQAIDRATSQIMTGTPLKLVLSNAGFERVFNVITNSLGNFTYVYKPTSGESGVYKISIVHPDVQDRPEQGSFTINRVFISPTSFNVNIPRNYNQSGHVTVKAGAGSAMTNVHLVYQASDQAGGVLATGVQISSTDTLNLAAGQSGDLNFTIIGDDTAAQNTNVVLKVYSDEAGTTPLASLPLNIVFSAAVPVLFHTPNYVETGLSQGTQTIETVKLQNQGLAPLKDVQISLIDGSGNPAPNWVYTTSQASLGTMNVGDQINVDIAITPPADLPDGIYVYKLHVTSSNYPDTDIDVAISVVQSGLGSVLFKAEDIYTATLNSNGELIQGLQGATLTLQNERVATQILNPQTTDVNGETIFQNIPSGWYKFRASSPNHQDVTGRVQIKAGLTASQEVFLDYNLVTVDWSVTETTIQDHYNITLTATYETNVPTAVVVIEPASVTLPPMHAGDVFNGEFTMTNHGLIRADDVFMNVPSNAYFRIEFQPGSIPTSLEAQQSIVVPYKVVALQDSDPSLFTADATGGGCSAPIACANGGFDSVCANGTKTSGSMTHCVTQGATGSSCGGSGGSSGGGGGTIGGWGGSATSSGSGVWAPPATSIGGGGCMPNPHCQGSDCKRDGCKGTPAGENGGGS